MKKAMLILIFSMSSFQTYAIGDDNAVEATPTNEEVILSDLYNGTSGIILEIDRQLDYQGKKINYGARNASGPIYFFNDQRKPVYFFNESCFIFHLDPVKDTLVRLGNIIAGDTIIREGSRYRLALFGNHRNHVVIGLEPSSMDMDNFNFYIIVQGVPLTTTLSDVEELCDGVFSFEITTHLQESSFGDDGEW